MQIHARMNDKGSPVKIAKPSAPTALSEWLDHQATSLVVPSGPMPPGLNNVLFSSWAPRNETERWEALAAEFAFLEPPMPSVPGKAPAAGVVTIEPDGRVWAVAPTNGFGGYDCTFPKGRFDGLSPRAAAIREAYEETGLKVELTGFLCDGVRSTTITRYYVARRVGGNPADMGWESQAVMLVPREDLVKVLTHKNDQATIAAIPTMPIVAYEFGLGSGYRILDCLAGYLARFGKWPTKLVIEHIMYDALRHTIFGQRGWFLLNQRLKVVRTEEQALYVEGPDGLRHDYDTNGPQELKRAASTWLWGTDLT